MSDEEFIKTYLKHRTLIGTARELGVTRQRVQIKLAQLKAVGVNIPIYASKRAHKYTPEYVEELNRLVESYGRN